jgi:predicted RNase H-like HicB family nuclease
MLRIPIIIERGVENFSAYVPDVSGCFSAGRSIDELRENIREAILLHLEGLQAEGEPIPTSYSLAEYIDISFTEGESEMYTQMGDLDPSIAYFAAMEPFYRKNENARDEARKQYDQETAEKHAIYFAQCQGSEERFSAIRKTGSDEEIEIAYETLLDEKAEAWRIFIIAVQPASEKQRKANKIADSELAEAGEKMKMRFFGKQEK